MINNWGFKTGKLKNASGKNPKVVVKALELAKAGNVNQAEAEGVKKTAQN